MRLPTQFKISKVAGAVSSMRPQLSGVIARREKVKVEKYVPTADGLGQTRSKDSVEEEHIVLYATDSYCFVKVDVGMAAEEDVDGPIPLEAMKHIERGVQVKLAEDEIVTGITHYDRVIAEGSAMLNPDNPLPQERYDELKPEDAKEPFRFALNGDLLARLAAAMGAHRSGVEIEFDMDEAQSMEGGKAKTYMKAIKVRPVGQSAGVSFQAEGLIMPIRINV